jgi:dTDP-4-amino-4,6-dideoxygalactose transaminase
MKTKIPLARPCLGKEELVAIKKVFESGILSEGSITKEFEVEFQSYLGIRNAVATSSCTTALDLSLLVLDIKHGDEIIVPDFTFPATGNVVFHVGAKPILVDIDIKTFNVNPEEIEKAITNKTKAIIPAHLFGQSAEMRTLIEIAEKYSLYIIEDAACGIGATHYGKKVGTFGDIACFSFHPRKIIAVGEGGMFVTKDDELAEKARVLKNHGIGKTIDGKLRFIKPGYNLRLNDVASAIGLVQLKKIDAFVQERAKLAKRYDDLLCDIRWVKTPHVALGNNHVYQTYCVMIQKAKIRDRLINELASKGIETQIGTYALHLQPFYVEHGGLMRRDLSFSESAFRNTLALPMYNGLSEEEQDYVCESLMNLLDLLA